jgi:hypothetical protein
MVAMRWTVEEFDRQPFPLTLDLIDYMNQPEKTKRSGRSPELEEKFRQAEMLPGPKNTQSDERQLPDWVREARQVERIAKMQKEIAERNG